jgi:hypothetical protein
VLVDRCLVGERVLMGSGLGARPCQHDDLADYAFRLLVPYEGLRVTSGDALPLFKRKLQHAPRLAHDSVVS